MNKLMRAVFILTGCLLAACAGQPTKAPNVQVNTAPRAQDVAAWQNSQVLIKQQKWAEAKSALNNLAQTNPQFSPVIINLAAVECQLQHWQEAASVLNRLPGAAQSPQGLNLLGVIAEHTGQLPQAEQYYLTSLASAGAPAEAQYNLALLYDIYWQDPIKALPYYEAYAKARPEDKAVADWISEIKRKAKH
jgi:tetratricopeptide (TPR) repeat protein